VKATLLVILVDLREQDILLHHQPFFDLRRVGEKTPRVGREAMKSWISLSRAPDGI
jgi:hypothetical protein